MALLAAVVLAGFAATGCRPAAAPPPAPAAPTTTTTTTTTTVPSPAVALAVAGDEFNGAAVNPAGWRAEHSTYGNSGGGSRHCLTPQNVSVSGGTLKIRSAKAATKCPDGSVQPYSSGFIGSRGAGRYYPLEGTFAMRARVPAAQGIWPAFWLRHRNGSSTAEVDIMESFHAQVPGKVNQVLHLDGEVNTANRATAFEAPTATPGWHEFAVRIERVAAGGRSGHNDVRFDFSVDGKPTHSYVDIDPVWLGVSDPSATWDIAINTAVDGRWVGNPDGALGQLDQLSRCSRSGTYPACSSEGLRRVDWTTPVLFEIDWVRVTPQ